MYVVYVTHEVYDPYMEWFENFDEALDFYHMMNKTPEHQATLLQKIVVVEDM